MRIAIVTPGFSSSEEDWCIPALRDVVTGLAEREEVEVFALRYPHRRDRYVAFGATVHAFGGATRRGIARLPMLMGAVRSLVHAGRDRPFDVVHAIWAHEPGWVAVEAGRRLGAPVLVSLFGGELARLPAIGYGGELSRANRWLTRSALRRAQAIGVGSSFLRHRAVKVVDERRLALLPLGVDTERFAPRGARVTETPALVGSPRLLQVGSLIPVKGVDTLLRAFVAVAHRMPEAHLHLVGEGEQRQQLEGLAVELGIAARVTFHGAVVHHELPAYYRRADLCVLASRWESFGMVALEAAACGIPTVGSAVGVLPDLEGASRTVPPGDATALEAMLMALLDDPAERTRMGRAALDLARGRYSLASAVAAHRRLYGELRGGGD